MIIRLFVLVVAQLGTIINNSGLYDVHLLLLIDNDNLILYADY